VTPETIAQLRELDAARTQGPLEVTPTPYGPSLDGPDGAQIFVESYGITWTPNHADAEFIAAAANHMDALLDAVEERDKVKRAAKTLGEVVHQNCRMILDITGLHDWVDEDGDGDWGAVWENAYELLPRIGAAEAEVSRLRAELAVCERTSQRNANAHMDAERRAREAEAALAEAQARIDLTRAALHQGGQTPSIRARAAMTALAPATQREEGE
jgi:hypothetical protein